jgi:hypothetical protein
MRYLCKGMNENTHRDPHRVVCVGDVLATRKVGATETLERLSRIGSPDRPWKFWHLGEPSMSARSLLREAIWRALGFDAGRLLLTLGTEEATGEGFDPADVSDGIRQCMDLLADKGPRELWLLLPVPSLWPLASRSGVEELRERLSGSSGRWRLVDAEPAAAAFLSAQSAHPDTAVALVEDSSSGPVPTGIGALLLAREIHSAWSA